ncbi:MAG: DJ-1/PfpI family protein, partial [Pseudomonadota bacterium]
MPISRDPRALTVALLAVPEASAAVVYGLHEVLSCVGTMWQTLTGESAQSRRLKPFTIGAATGPMRTTMGATVVVDHALTERRRPDVVIVGDLDLTHGTPRGRWPRECDWLRKQHARGVIVCSVCTGSLLLAEAGLLEGREATSHWSAGGVFRELYSQVDLKLERVLVPSGEAHDVVTSGGSASWTDLSLYLIARFCGAPEARRIAKIFLFGDRSDGQLPFAAMVRPRQHEDAVIADCQAWLAMNYFLPNPVAEMTRRSGLAPRTFVRRFRSATGHTPIDYAQTL